MWKKFYTCIFKLTIYELIFFFESALIQGMTYCRQVTGHYLSQWWPVFIPPYDITLPQCDTSQSTPAVMIPSRQNCIITRFFHYIAFILSYSKSRLKSGTISWFYICKSNKKSKAIIALQAYTIHLLSREMSIFLVMCLFGLYLFNNLQIAKWMLMHWACQGTYI